MQSAGDGGARFGSDAVAEVLRALGLPYIALNPGASYRGLHDSLVNHLGNERPELLICLHEEHAVALAHGYAKVTERPLGVALHANVGLQHATMAIFNALCDRVPMVMVGATGPLDAARRRPWIDWIHTENDQARLVRDYVKWDDQPGSVQAAVDSVAHAAAVAGTYPCGPVYVCLDAALQEDPLPAGVTLPDVARHAPPAAPAPSPTEVVRALELLEGAARPLLLVGRGGRGQAAWDARVHLTERFDAAVLSDLKTAASFPTAHPLHTAVPGTFLTDSGRELVAAADLVLALDWVDLAGTLRAAEAAPRALGSVHLAGTQSGPRVIACGLPEGHFAHPPADVAIAAHPDRLVDALLERAGGAAPARTGWPPARAAGRGDGPLAALAAALREALAGGPTCLVRLPLGWDGADLEAADPLDYLGQDGGAGLGSGPGMAVGAALALRGSNRLPVAVLGDGDFLMGASALWTAARYRLPLLVVVANNRSFFNDEIHQERVARARGRAVENRWIGQHIRDPEPDVAALARSLGLRGEGPVRDPKALGGVLAEAAAAARAGAAVVVDVHVGP
ncbi:MAG TPA: thiamine pyrophosphate-dependent enzyme [Solirubrobacteraceae bacterium]